MHYDVRIIIKTREQNCAGSKQNEIIFGQSLAMIQIKFKFKRRTYAVIIITPYLPTTYI